MRFEYKPASMSDLEAIWDKNIADHPGDGRWLEWKAQYIKDNLWVCKMNCANDQTIYYGNMEVRSNGKVLDQRAVTGFHS